MGLSETLTLIAMEAHNSDQWKYDNNTTMLIILQKNLKSLLEAVLMISNNCENLEEIDVAGLVTGLAETLEWICDNTQMVERKATDGNG